MPIVLRVEKGVGVISTMYEINLSSSLFPALQDRSVIQSSIGAVLKNSASQYGNTEALVEVTQDGKLGRRWNYDSLYQDSLKLAFALSGFDMFADLLC